MIIHPPEILVQDDHLVVWSRIELQKKIYDFPDFLWYRIPNQYQEFISLHSDAFLIPGLTAGMHFRETIRVRGTVSPRLAYHLEEYQFILANLLPQYVQRVDVQYDKLKSLYVKPGSIGTMFSGGVDSFFTLMHHSPQIQPNPEYQITHAVFVNGFDIVRRESSKFQMLYSRYSKALQDIDIELIPVETNLVSTIVPRLRYTSFYGPVLVGCSMLLGGLFKRFIISSSWDYYQLSKFHTSSNPLSDRLLSTETLEIEHFGANYRRVEKVEAISDWALAQEHLRVCGHPDLEEHKINCSRCEKCTRTMIPLYAIGKLQHFSTFHKPFKHNWDILRWARKFNPTTAFVTEAFIFAKKRNPALLKWLWLAAGMGYLRFWLIRLVPVFMKKWLRPYGYFTDHLREEHALENPEVIRLLEIQN